MDINPSLRQYRKSVLPSIFNGMASARALLITGLIAAAWLGLSIGAAEVDLGLPYLLLKQLLTTPSADAAGQPHLLNIVTNIRFPRVLFAMLIGAALAVSGASLQGLCRNPLADPGLLGISSGAAVFAVAVIVFGTTVHLPPAFVPYLLPLAAFAGAALTCFVVYRLAQINGRLQIVTLLLAGVVINAVGNALISAMSFAADDQSLRLVTYWLMGSLSGASWDGVMLITPVVLAVIYLLYRKRHALNLLLLGETDARCVGVNVERVKTELLMLNALAVGVVVSVSGIIGFVGLVVPHVLRMAFGSDYRQLIVNTALCGAILMLLADIMARMIVQPAELPIGIVTALLGSPVFLMLLIQQKRRLTFAI